MDTTALPKSAVRPRSFPAVLALGEERGGDIDSCLREFLDEFYICQEPLLREAMLSAEPPLNEDAKVNAYLAAVAEHLARRYKLNAPDWINHKSRFLRRAYFPCGLESLKATLLVESPTAFRRRMIFVGADPLYRPRKDSCSIG